MAAHAAHQWTPRAWLGHARGRHRRSQPGHPTRRWVAADAVMVVVLVAAMLRIATGGWWL